MAAHSFQGLNKFVQDRVERLGLAHLFGLPNSRLGRTHPACRKRIRSRKYLNTNYADFVRGGPHRTYGSSRRFGTRGFFFGETANRVCQRRPLAWMKVVIRGS